MTKPKKLVDKATVTANRSQEHLNRLVSIRLYITIFFGTLLILYRVFLAKYVTPFHHHDGAAAAAAASSSSSYSSSSNNYHHHHHHTIMGATAFTVPIISTNTPRRRRSTPRRIRNLNNNRYSSSSSSSSSDLENNINNPRRNRLFVTYLSSTTAQASSSHNDVQTSEEDVVVVADNDDDGGSILPSSSSSTIITPTGDTYQAPALEINRRRNLAIISHPDSGKTTMTEKLLLYGGAVQQAGAVRFKSSGKSTTSDFMELEQQRGISISSTVLNFEYNNTYGIRLMDTPGHNDFSEDTYRALSAADNALMLLDGAKGLEPQTRKLFEVCRLRQLPIFTFVNKLDRPSLSPYTIMDQIEKEFALSTYPVVWPIGDGERFKGVLDRTTDTIYLYTKADTRGGKASVQQIRYNDENLNAIEHLIDDNELFTQLNEDYEMLHELIEPLDMDRVMAGTQSPLFFGSAITSFGVDLFLNHFCTMGAKPTGRNIVVTNTNNIENTEDDETTAGAAGTDFIGPDHEEFTGFIFKTQANLDPKHRDRLAYVRVISGMYQKGMKVGHSRSKPSKRYTLAQAQTLLGADRTSIEVAYPGDVIGINNPGNFLIGDTLYTGTTTVQFPGIPSFSPEKFVYIRSPNPSDYKSFRKGIDQLLAEGAVQSLRQRGNDDNNSGPLILAAVGQLQFEVVQARLKNEYNVDCIMEPINYNIARWVDGGWDAIKKADDDGKLFGTMIVQDKWNRPVILFRNDWKAAAVEKEEAYLQLKPWSHPPSDY